MPLSCPGREIVLAIASSALASLAAAQQPPEPGQTAAPAALPVDRVPARVAESIEVSLDGPAPESGAPRAAGPAGGPASAGSTPTRYGPPPVAFTFVRAIVTARSEVRTAPHPSAPVLFAVEAASVVDASDAPVGGFRRIRTADGRGGYVADGSVRIELSRPQ